MKDFFFFSLLTIYMPLIRGLCWGVWERAILHQIDLSLHLNSTIYLPHGFKSLNIFYNLLGHMALNHLIFLSFGFLFCKNRVLLYFTLRMVMRINWKNKCENVRYIIWYIVDFQLIPVSFFLSLFFYFSSLLELFILERYTKEIEMNSR